VHLVIDRGGERRELRVPVFSGGTSQGEEVLPVVAVGDGRYLLLASPGFIEGIAAGDEFVLDASAAGGHRVLRRGGNLCVWFYHAEPVDESGVATADIRLVAESLGGRLDGGYSHMLVLTVPLAAGFDAVAAAFDAAVRRHAGSAWLYGNVYDPSDGMTPLNWW
jgi:hypothetical protein